ncbi:MAG: hypothetical protein OXN89_25245 [Bryobacterales bacterium]|nr:hypothetical protein [Bryobacterales bacterium]
MAHYFNTVLLPRVKKVTYSPAWKNGRPARLATCEEADRSPRIVKVVRLESYEDTLNNLDVRRPEPLQRLLDGPSARCPSGAREDYVIRYMLDVETRHSPSLLNLASFLDPFAYLLKVKRPGSDESLEVAVDLIETFNWLLGLRVASVVATRSFSATFSACGKQRRVAALSPTGAGEGRWWFRAVEGKLPDDRRALIIWRNRPGGDEPDGIERDNAVLDAWFRESRNANRHGEFDLVYANGDHNLESLKEPDQNWAGQVIEDHFTRLMFEGAEDGDRAW